MNDPFMLRSPHTGNRADAQCGYILIMLMLFVALLAIAAAAAAPTIAFEIRRDREEEMIHRGVQYSRAIKKYVKKTGSFPSRIEDLENTNNIRFLRKRYKDPITNKDFRLLHVGDVQLTATAGIAGATAIGGGTIPGASALGAAQSGSPLGGAGASSMMGGAASSGAAGAGATAGGTGDQSSPDAAQGKADSSSPDQSQTGTGQAGSGGDKLSSQVFGGGPIVGVASISKAQSIREFNHKNHYDKWQFVYDPTMDSGGLITTPAQPPLQVSAPLQPNSNGQGQNPSPSSSGMSGSGNSGFSMSPQSPQSPPPALPAPQQPQ